MITTSRGLHVTQEQTFVGEVGMSEMCHEQTWSIAEATKRKSRPKAALQFKPYLGSRVIPARPSKPALENTD
jgi:hypothetical protein